MQKKDEGIKGITIKTIQKETQRIKTRKKIKEQATGQLNWPNIHVWNHKKRGET